ncbi:Retrovirus-related Pol polyprotein [Oopsacas minuta]|uniref:Retrovirus-related Pol polyprotein n=1 Tax=Oopsacas minuta TaxID=111878 RepID=A0AAV7JR52_9METZ|nr:Retrovirus-related Pol polyprotein [Oopsacas minuta]
MAAPLNISIPPLKPDERVEDWQSLFVAATSSLAAYAGEKAAILILPSYVCRNEYEREIALIAIKEESIEAAFNILCNALDSPIDEYEATARFRSKVWARGMRIEVFFSQLWKEAKRAGFLNRQVAVVLITQLPGKAQAALKKWVQERKEDPVSDGQMREFIGLVQQNLRQAEVPLDYRAREGTSNSCKVINQGKTDILCSSDSEYEEKPPTVYKVRTFGTSSRQGRFPDSRRAPKGLVCYTCGKHGHGYHCRLARRDSYQDKRTNVRDYIKSVDQIGPYDDKSASISVRVYGQPILALLDTGAKVNVVDRQTVEYLGLGQFIKPEIGHVYGVCGTPVSVVGSIEIPIEVNGEKAGKTHVQVLDGNVKATIKETAVGGTPIARARTVRIINTEEVDKSFKCTKTDLTTNQHDKFADLLKEFEAISNDKPGRTSMCEHAIDTGKAVPTRSKPRRVPPREEEINSQLDEMLDQKLYNASHSPWASNVVLVTKKDGRQSFAIDYTAQQKFCCISTNTCFYLILGR